MTSVGFQLSLIIWPDVVKQHVGMVKGLWVFAVLLWVIWLISYLSDNERIGARPVIAQNFSGELNLNNTGTIGNLTHSSHHYHAPKSSVIAETPVSTIKSLDEPVAISLECLPHVSQNPVLCLEVTNKGRKLAALTAEIRILSKIQNGSLPVDSRPFAGEWEPPSTYRPKYYDLKYERGIPKITSLNLEAGRQRLLRIAEMNSDNGVGTEESTAWLIGKNEVLRWDFEPRQNSHLPKLRLQINFTAKGAFVPFQKIYDVGPAHTYGNWSMTEVEA